MSLLSPHQPISFCTVNGCGCGDSDWCAPYQQGDFLAFQFRRNKPLAASGINLVTNGDFATDLSGWSNSGNPANSDWYWDAGAARADDENMKVIAQNILLKAKKYSFSFDYDVSLTATFQIVAYKEYQDNESTDFEVLDQIIVSSPGSYSTDFVLEDEYVRFGVVVLQSPLGAADTRIDNLNLQAFTSPYTINITDCEGNVEATLTADHYEVFDEYVNVKVKFSDLGLADGRYFVCMPGSNVFANPDLNNEGLLFWEQDHSGNEWNGETEGQARAIISGSEETATIYQEFCELEKDTEYEVCLTVTAGHSFDWHLIINDVDYGAGTFTGDDVCWTFTSPEDINTIGFKVKGDGTADLSEVGFTNSGLTADVCSGCINLAAEHECSKLISWSDSCDNYGMYWAYFTAYMRVKAGLKNPRYSVTDEEQFINSRGNRLTLSAYVAERKELLIDNLPGQLWNALATAVTTDYFKIDGISYTKATGDIDPDWRKSNSFVSNGVIELYRNKQPNWKNYCFKKKSLTDNEGCGCDLSDYYTKSEVNTLLSNYYTKSQVDVLLGSYHKQGGNSYGATSVIGTIDNNAVHFLRNNAVRAGVNTSNQWFWNAVTGGGIFVPSADFHYKASGTTSASYAFKYEASSGAVPFLLQLRNDGVLIFGATSSDSSANPRIYTGNISAVNKSSGSLTVFVPEQSSQFNITGVQMYATSGNRYMLQVTRNFITDTGTTVFYNTRLTGALDHADAGVNVASVMGGISIEQTVSGLRGHYRAVNIALPTPGSGAGIVYGLYQSNGGRNYLDGSLGIGTLPGSTYKLNVLGSALITHTASSQTAEQQVLSTILRGRLINSTSIEAYYQLSSNLAQMGVADPSGSYSIIEMADTYTYIDADLLEFYTAGVKTGEINAAGYNTLQDIEVTVDSKGIVLLDRNTATRRRIYIDNNALALEIA